MDLFRTLWDAFSLDEKSLQELIEISRCVDIEKGNNGHFANSAEDTAVIASTIVALLNEKSTFFVGEKLYAAINEEIVCKNSSVANTENGKKIYEQIRVRNVPGTYRIRKTRTGYRFELIASNGEFLTASEVYSSLDSCTNGIKSVQKNAQSPVEDQTEEGYESVRNPKYEVYVDKAGEFRFRLKLMNGQIVAVSEGYKTKNACLTAIERVKASADSNDIEKS